MKKQVAPEKGRSGSISAMTKLTRLFELPKEITLDLPLVSLVGRQEVNVENFKGVIEYAEERVRINTSCGVLRIEGKNLEIMEITSEAAVITGVVGKLEFDV